MSDAQNFVVMNPDEYKQRAITESLEQAANLRLDHTRPGGAYLLGGVLVDANGLPITEQEEGAALSDMNRASQEELDALAEEVKQLRAKLAEAEAQPGIVTGRPADDVPTGADSEPFLSQMTVSVDREEVEKRDETLDPGPGFAGYMDRTMKELTDEANERGVDLSGVKTKSDLAERLVSQDLRDETEFA